MDNKTLTMEEAMIAATYERVSMKITGRAWIEMLCEWQTTGQSEPTDQMRAVLAEVAHEIKLYVGDKAAVNVQFPIH